MIFFFFLKIEGLIFLHRPMPHNSQDWLCTGVALGKGELATVLGLASKLGLIPKKFKTLIERPQYIYICKN
jgi:hypothetical protein